MNHISIKEVFTSFELLIRFMINFDKYKYPHFKPPCRFSIPNIAIRIMFNDLSSIKFGEGLFAEFESQEKFEKNIQMAEKALALVEEAQISTMIHESQTVLATLRILHAIKQLSETFNISDKKMIQQTRSLREKEGLHVLPAATAGLAAMLEMHASEPLEPDRYVAILTGKK